jgi:hypothetical protein
VAEFALARVRALPVAQRAELDEARTAVLVNADRRSEHGTARDVAGAYNSQFVSFKRRMSDTALIFAAYRKEIERAASNKYDRFAIGDYEIRQLLRFRESWVRRIVHYAVRSAASQVAIKLY